MKPAKKAKSAPVQTASVPAAGPPREGWRRAVALLLAIVPCFWQSRIQAGDLGSHIYNSWLAHLVETGRAPGLAIVPLTTNVLFDLVLKALWERFGADVAQRVAVAAAVLVLVSGAFAFVRRVSGRRAWSVFPILVMLAYGWTFHMGLFNFYTSLGLSFWALALAWRGGAARLAGAAALLALAFVAHGLPVGWSVAVLAYRAAARRLRGKRRSYLFGGSLAAIAAGSVLLRFVTETHWFARGQFYSMLAADQLWVYDDPYVAPAVALLVVWGVLLAGLFRGGRARRAAAGVPFQICALLSAGIFLIPTWIQIPGYTHPLVFLAERMSLALGICVCALAARARIPRLAWVGTAAAGLYFFGCLYSDESALNAFESRMETVVRLLPPGQRMLAPFVSFQRINAVAHTIDRACIGHCYSYGNYEPSSRQFRVRAEGPSPLVIADDIEIGALTLGRYRAKERDLPLYEVVNDNGQLKLRSMAAGDQSMLFDWR